jgi:hypothetical protein
MRLVYRHPEPVTALAFVVNMTTMNPH